MEFETGFDDATRKFLLLLYAFEKASYYVPGLKPAICKEMKKDLRNIYLSVLPSVIDTSPIAAVKNVS